MADGNFEILDLDEVRAVLDAVMRGETGDSTVDDMYADLSEHGKGFLLGYVNGYHECMVHMSLADLDDSELG